MGAQSELIRSVYSIVDAAQWDRLGEVFASDAVYHRPGYADMCGLAEVVTFYRDVRMIASGRHEVIRIVTDETCGSCWGRFVGWSRSGEPLEEYFTDWYTFTDCVIHERRTFFYRPAI